MIILSLIISDNIIAIISNINTIGTTILYVRVSIISLASPQAQFFPNSKAENEGDFLSYIDKFVKTKTSSFIQCQGKQATACDLACGGKDKE